MPVRLSICLSVCLKIKISVPQKRLSIYSRERPDEFDLLHPRLFLDRKRGKWAVYYTCPQSLIIASSYSLLNNFGDVQQFIVHCIIPLDPWFLELCSYGCDPSCFIETQNYTWNQLNKFELSSSLLKKIKICMNTRYYNGVKYININ